MSNNEKETKIEVSKETVHGNKISELGYGAPLVASIVTEDFENAPTPIEGMLLDGHRRVIASSTVDAAHHAHTKPEVLDSMELIVKPANRMAGDDSDQVRIKFGYGTKESFGAGPDEIEVRSTRYGKEFTTYIHDPKLNHDLQIAWKAARESGGVSSKESSTLAGLIHQAELEGAAQVHAHRPKTQHTRN